MLDKKWETKPCECYLDYERKPIPFMSKCNSLTIPGIIGSPLEAKLATMLVEDHNTMLDIKEIHKLMPQSPFEGYGLNL